MSEYFHLQAQVFAELLGATGGICGIRLEGQTSQDPEKNGFHYDDGDHCWRCDGVTTFGEASFANDGSHWMLPPFALDNNDWHLSPDWADWLPFQVTVGGKDFLLAGVTMSEPGHFTSLILLDKQWYFYDGLQGHGYLKPIGISELKRLKSFLCYAYYLSA